MNTCEKMKLYIERTKISEKSRGYYCLVWSEIKLLIAVFQSEDIDSKFDAICLAFNYGMAKGYRAAKAEARK